MEEECEYGLPNGTCFTARRLEVVAVAGLLWIYFVVCFLVFGGISCFFFVFFTSNAHGLLPVRGNLASCTSLLVMRPFLPLGQKSLCIPGAYMVPLFSLSVCVTFVVFTDCESCTRPIPTNPGSMEARECGRTRGTCFVAHRLEVVAVAGLLWISWCVLGGADFFVFIFFRFFFPSNAHGPLQV